MKKRHYVAVAALVASAMVGCSGTKEVKSTTGLNLANLDTTVSAGTDFYRYACGKNLCQPIRSYRLAQIFTAMHVVGG